MTVGVALVPRQVARRRRLVCAAFASALLFGCVAGGFAQAVPAPAANLVTIRKAAELIVRGDLAGAERELQSVLAADPNDYRALNLLGVVRGEQHRNSEAEALFHTALQAKPEYAGAHVNLGLLYAQTGRDEEAVRQLQEALRLDPGRRDASAALVNIWRAQAAGALHHGELEKSLSLLMRARKRAPQDPEVNYEFAMVALRMSLYVDSAQALRQVLAVRKDDPAAVYGLARAQIGLGKFSEARDLLAKYVELRPADASGHYGFGLVLGAMQQTAEARREFQRSLELQPAQTESYVELGKLDLKHSDLDGAAREFQQVLQHAPTHAEALLGMGRVELQRKQYQSAADFLDRAVAANPNLRQAHYYLGLTYARLQRTEDSKKELNLASKLEHQELEKERVFLKLMGPEAPAQ